MEPAALRILAKDQNTLGDLFTSVVGDLIHSIGYDVTNLNVARAGREIDVEAKHRLEPHSFLIAECKATREKIGGDAVNKFVGATDGTRRMLRQRSASDAFRLSSYYISLGGFTGSAKEQEEEFGNERVTLLDGSAVMKQLVDGKVVVPVPQVVDAASRQLPNGSALQLAGAEMWIHPRGKFWAVLYKDAAGATQVALVHGDGSVVPREMAEEVFRAGRTSEKAKLINRAPYAAGEGEPEARAAYLRYVKVTCGQIQLDGLPADEAIGSKKLELETLFVPLRLAESSMREESEEEGAAIPKQQPRPKSDPRSVGAVLDELSRIAILASPGGGKSTLLKRIAVAYAFPERHDRTDDHLPDRPWFPLLIRCRDLGEQVRQPILSVLEALAVRAEVPAALRGHFADLVGDELRKGTALLLIDGLDEISNDGDRIAFVTSLRTFLGTYPAIPVVITSREAGFRVVSGSLAGECRRFRIADFDDEEVTELVSRWHREVYGDSEEQQKAASSLAAQIIANDRIRLLAANPLLLTTLLLVKRWVGQLPTKRSVLYEKAIEVLLMTWNTQGYEPIPLDEALPRLEFIAFSMMKEGVQKVTLSRLRELLQQARAELQEELGFSTLSDDEFIRRVEYRSSLLIHAGQTIVDGSLEPLYEFRHLTFQEYLVARAITKGHYPERADSDTPASILSPHLRDEAWMEVVPLTAVLAGRRAKEIVQALMAEEDLVASRLVVECLADEVQLAPGDLDAVLEWTATHWSGGLSAAARLVGGKFGARFEAMIRRVLSADDDATALSVVEAFSECEFLRREAEGRLYRADLLCNELASEDPVVATSAALAVMYWAWGRRYAEVPAQDFDAFVSLIEPLLQAPAVHTRFAAAWAFGWIAEHWSIEQRPSVLLSLAKCWANTNASALREEAVWATCQLARHPHQMLADFPLDPELRHQIEAAAQEPVNDDMAARQPADAALTLKYYLRLPITAADRQYLSNAAKYALDHEWPNRMLRFIDAAY